MKQFSGRVAVVTGAASGIGRALAQQAAREGMKVVLADVEESALAAADAELEKRHASVLAVRTDVSRPQDVEALARKTLEAFGAVHLLFNNAGVSSGGAPIWETPLHDWEWVMGVNLWGVVHGVRVFVPIMLAQSTECHVVNTGSVAGLCALGAAGNYTVAKFGVVGLSEVLYQDLARARAKVGVSVLCPAWVKTRLIEARRNRPAEQGADAGYQPLTAEQQEERWAAIAQKWTHLGAVLPPERVAEITFDAIRKEQFYIVPHKEVSSLVRARARDITSGRNPASAKVFT